jgi:hypothetical protein
MAAAMLGSDGDAQTAALHAAADRYAQVLGVPARQIVSSTLESREQLRQLASAMGLQVAPGAPARRLLEATMPMGTQDTHALRAHDKTLIEVRPEPLAPQVALNRGLSELRAALAGNPCAWARCSTWCWTRCTARWTFAGWCCACAMPRPASWWAGWAWARGWPTSARRFASRWVAPRMAICSLRCAPRVRTC